MNKQNKKLDLEEALNQLGQTKQKIERDLNLGHELLKEIERERRIPALTVRGLAIAAILLVAAWVFGPSFVSIDNQDLFAENYDKLIVDLDSRNDTEQDILTKAIGFYQEGDIDKAMAFLNRDSIVKEYPYESSFYNALCSLEAKQFQNAKTALINSIDDENTINPAVYWYLALTNLELGHYKEVKQNLRELKESDPSLHKNQRRKLMRKLRFRYW